MFQTGRIANRPQGMNAGNNMAFLQQAQTASRQPSYNPFAGGAGGGFGGGLGGIGALLQQFSQGGGGGFGNIGVLLQQFGGGMNNSAWGSPAPRSNPSRALPLNAANSPQMMNNSAWGAAVASANANRAMAQQQAMLASASASGPAMTQGGGRFSGMAPRPQGMNAGNNMAFLRQAQASRPRGFNPFA